MAKLRVTGKRSQIEGKLTLGAGSYGMAREWQRFDIAVQEEGDFPGNRNYRWHTIELDRDEAKQVAEYLLARLASMD